MGTMTEMQARIEELELENTRLRYGPEQPRPDCGKPFVWLVNRLSSLGLEKEAHAANFLIDMADSYMDSAKYLQFKRADIEAENASLNAEMERLSLENERLGSEINRIVALNDKLLANERRLISLIDEANKQEPAVSALRAEVEQLRAYKAADGHELDPYDAGYLNDFGGGNVGWWHDYIRAELARAHDHYTSQIPIPSDRVADKQEIHEADDESDSYTDHHSAIAPVGSTWEEELEWRRSDEYMEMEEKDTAHHILADRITEQDAREICEVFTQKWEGNELPITNHQWAKCWPPVERLLNKLNADRAVSVPDVDWLAETIRRVDGAHKLGAGALAEKIIDAMLSASPAQTNQNDDLAQRLLGRAAFLRDRGEIKTPELLESAANAIR